MTPRHRTDYRIGAPGTPLYAPDIRLLGLRNPATRRELAQHQAAPLKDQG